MNISFDSFHKEPESFLTKQIYDVKILYDLEGRETENLINLANSILGAENTIAYRNCMSKVNAFIKSYNIAGIKWSDFTLDKLLSKDLFTESINTRTAILKNLYDKSREKSFYEKFYPIVRCLADLNRQPVYIDLESIKDDDSHYSKLLKSSVSDGKLYFNLKPVGAKTGRLSFKKGTVNFYVLPKNLRKCVVAPPNYHIFQFDFKSFQPRLAIFSTEDQSFKEKFADVEDIYSLFPGDREENKLAFISWMFSKRKNDLFEQEASPILQLRRNLLIEAKSNGFVKTKFDRTLYWSNEEENVILQNYVTATEVDAILSLAVKTKQILSISKSRLIMPFHDCLLFYIHDDELTLVNDIKNCMENEHISLFGSKMPVSVKSGKNFEEMNDHK